MLEVTEKAKAKVLQFIQSTQQHNLCLRVNAQAQTAEDKWSFSFALEPSTAMKPNDLKVSSEGFDILIHSDIASVVENAKIDWAEKDGQEGFCIPQHAVTAPSKINPGDKELEEKITEKLKEIYDPEIPVNIYDLGLIYKVSVNEAKEAHVLMTLTTPNCPAAEQLPEEVRQKAESVLGVQSAKVELTWEPAWDKNMMSESALLELGL